MTRDYTTVERSIIGCAISDPIETAQRLSGMLQPADFRDYSCRIAYTALLRDPPHFTAALAIDAISSAQAREIVADCQSVAAPLDTVMRQADVLAKRTATEAFFAEIRDVIQRTDGDIDAAAEALLPLITHAGTSTDKTPLRPIADVYEAFTASYTSSTPDGVPVPLRGLELLFGHELALGEVWTHSARPGIGKSSLIAACLWAWASMGIKTAFFTGEMGAGDEIKRQIARCCTDITLSEIRNPRVRAERGNEIVSRGRSGVVTPNLWITDESDLSLPWIESQLYRVSAQGYYPQVVVIDNLQLLSPDASLKSSYQAEMRLTSDIKRLAKRHHILVVLLSQVTKPARDVDDRYDPITQQSVKGSGTDANSAYMTGCYQYAGERHNSGGLSDDELADLNATRPLMVITSLKNRHEGAVTSALLMEFDKPHQTWTLSQQLYSSKEHMAGIKRLKAADTQNAAAVVAAMDAAMDGGAFVKIKDKKQPLPPTEFDLLDDDGELPFGD